MVAFILPIITIILLVTMGDYFDLLHTNPQILITTVGLAISNIIFFFIFMLAINSTNINPQEEVSRVILINKILFKQNATSISDKIWIKNKEL